MIRKVSRIAEVWREEGALALLSRVKTELRLRALAYCDYWFDLWHGVDTCGVVFQNAESDVGPEAVGTAVRYEPTPVRVIRSILAKLPEDTSDFTFVDYGSGKGRVLLLAAEYPFKAIVGFELSRRLSEIANRNILGVRHLLKKCLDIESRCIDASRAELPSGPLVIYFSTPFIGTVRRQVFTSICESMRADPRRIVIIYFGSRREFVEIATDIEVRSEVVYAAPAWGSSGAYTGQMFVLGGNGLWAGHDGL